MRRSVKKIQLPVNFAQQILDCEIQLKLADKASKQTIRKLIELYTLGVEYYESIRSHKYLYFHMKLNEMFTSPSTVSSLEQKTIETEQQSPIKKKLNSINEEQKIQALKIKQKQQKMIKYMKEKTNENHTNDQVQNILSENDNKEMMLSQKIKKQIDTQEQKLTEKLQRRKSKLLFSKSFASSESIQETETRSSLFVEPSLPSLESNSSPIVKPIEVTFENIIKEDQSDDENLSREIQDAK